MEEARDLGFATFLCSKDTTSACKLCHDSCSCAADSDVCTSCTDTSNAVANFDNSACLCSGSKGGDTYHKACTDCHVSCTTCFAANNNKSCLTCADSDSTPQEIGGGMMCFCRDGFVFGLSPCVSCVDGCPYCLGPDASDCVSPQEKDFITIFQYYVPTLGLPYLTETNDMMCYRTKRPVNACDTGTALGNVMGDIADYDTKPALPTPGQCRSLLTALWPYVNHWFDVIFPNFTGPDYSSYADRLIIKSILKLWIIQFGPTVVDTWDDIKTAMLAPGPWTTYSADATQFSTDNQVNFHPFPAELSNWKLSAEEHHVKT